MPSRRLLLAAFIFLHSSLIISHAASPPPEFAILRDQYDRNYAEQVTAPFEANKAVLDGKFTAALDSAIATAKAAGDLPTVLAIQDDKKRLAEKMPIPDDDDKTPEALKRLRAIYREQLAKLTEQRTANTAALLKPYSAKLHALEVTLTKVDRVAEAKWIMDYRQGIEAGSGTEAPAPATPSTKGVPSTAVTGASVPPATHKVKGDDRKAAEWILANWSDSRVMIDEKHVKSIADLPKGRFTVTGIAIDGRFYTGATPLNQSVLMEHLGGLDGVRSIALGGFPDLKDDDLAFIGTLSSLEELKLSRLACTDAFLVHLKSLKKLRKLAFGELPNLTGTGFAQLAELPALDGIVHWKGGMTDAGVAAIATLPSVSSLDFQSSPAVTDASIPHLRTMGKLTFLLLSNTSITSEGLAGVVMPKIITVAANELSKLPMSDLAPKMAAVFPNVETYMFAYFASTPADLAALAHYNKLKKLTVSGTIKDEAWPGLLELRGLGVFQSYSHTISSAAWQTLAKLKKLKVVRYGTKPPDEAALAAFKKQRPDVKVEP